MIEKKEFIDQIMVNEHNSVHVRKRTEITENGNILSQLFHRSVLNPGDELKGQDEKVKKVCELFWSNQ